MATSTYVALATTTLSSADSNITFSSIPATYRDLVLVVSARSSTGGSADNMGIYFNSDTSNSYTTVRMYGTGSTTGSSTSPAPSRIAQITIPGSGTSEFGVATIHIMDYSATDKHTTALIRSNTPSDQVHAAAGRWANTVAVSSVSIDLYATAANFVAGSTFSLYGIEA